MRSAPSWLTTTLEWCGVFVVLVVSVPVVFVVVFVLRAVLLGTALAALIVGVVLFGCAPRFRRWVLRPLGERRLRVMPAGGRGRH